MKSWTVLTRIGSTQKTYNHTNHINEAVHALTILENQFPDVKFKIGKTCKPRDWEVTCYGDGPRTSIMGLLPTPHPNDETKEIILWILNGNLRKKTVVELEK